MKINGKQFIALMLFLYIMSEYMAAQPSQMKGIISDIISGEPVEYAQILNFSLHKQTYSNRLGEFTLEVREGDTLVVYGLGFLYEKVIVTRILPASESMKINLTRQPYNLAAANIPGFGNYEDFKDKLINVEVARTKTEILNESIRGPALQAAMEGFQEYMNANPVIARVPIYTPEEIERMKLDKIIAREKVRDQVYHKYNPALVKEITGLTDDDEIIEFMVWCDFQEAYILESNEYDLAERIAAKFELFKKKKADESIQDEPINRIDRLTWQFA